MLERNIKQSLTSLEVFDKLEEKIYKDELLISSIFNTNPNCIIYDKFGLMINIENGIKSHIEIFLSDDYELKITSSKFSKSYIQTLSDQEYNDIKERFLKIAQKHQDDFENWIKDTDDNNGIDGE